MCRECGYSRTNFVSSVSTVRTASNILAIVAFCALCALASAACAASARRPGSTTAPPGDETATDGGTSVVPDATDTSVQIKDAGTDARAKLSCVEGSTDGGVLDVWVRRESNAVFIVVPALGVHERWLDLATPMRCDGDPRRATPRLTTVCSAQETSFTLDLTVDDGVLVATSSTREYGGRRTEPAMGPTRLPCGAHVVFHGLTFRDPRWTRFASPCLSKCLDRTELCVRPCAARHTGNDDELTPEGVACMQRCNEAEATCMEKCPPG
jgi:hypothetical protein